MNQRITNATTPAGVWRDRPPTEGEFEKLRLILSTFRDGSGLLSKGPSASYPHWIQVERAIAEAFGGYGPENKGVFDVFIRPTVGIPYGLSVKTSADRRNGRVLMELTNSNAKMWARLKELSIDPEVDPAGAGDALIRLVREWHMEVASEVDIRNSSYVVLTHDKTYTRHRLYWFPLELPDAASLSWSHKGRHIAGKVADEAVMEWYGWSGGQLKFYPHPDEARWVSAPFVLEEPPLEPLAEKAGRYWPGKWEAASG